MVSRIFFVVPGEPVPKARPRFTMQGGKARTYTPTSSAAYETTVGLLARSAMAQQCGTEPMRGELAVRIAAFLPVPASWSRKRREESVGAWHGSRPDLDNIVKAAMDGMNGVVWKDDAQVANLYATKQRSREPRLEVQVAELCPKNQPICVHKAQTQCWCRGSSREAKNAPKRETGALSPVHDERQE